MLPLFETAPPSAQFSAISETEAHRLFWHKAEVIGPRSEFMSFDIPLALDAMTA